MSGNILFRASLVSGEDDNDNQPPLNRWIELIARSIEAILGASIGLNVE